MYGSKSTDTHSECNTCSFSMATVVKCTHLSVKFILTLPVLFPSALLCLDEPHVVKGLIYMSCKGVYILLLLT
jgi:hypothetical protein